LQEAPVLSEDIQKFVNSCTGFDFNKDLQFDFLEGFDAKRNSLEERVNNFQIENQNFIDNLATFA